MQTIIRRFLPFSKDIIYSSNENFFLRRDSKIFNYHYLSITRLLHYILCTIKILMVPQGVSTKKATITREGNRLGEESSRRGISHYALFPSRLRRDAGGGLIIHVSPYFWKRSADGARIRSRHSGHAFPRLQSSVVHLENRAYFELSRQVSSEGRLSLGVNEDCFFFFGLRSRSIHSRHPSSDMRTSARLDAPVAISFLFV